VRIEQYVSNVFLGGSSHTTCSFPPIKMLLSLISSNLYIDDHVK
jgi:hypothetical protein